MLTCYFGFAGSISKLFVSAYIWFLHYDHWLALSRLTRFLFHIFILYFIFSFICIVMYFDPDDGLDLSMLTNFFRHYSPICINCLFWGWPCDLFLLTKQTRVRFAVDFSSVNSDVPVILLCIFVFADLFVLTLNKGSTRTRRANRKDNMANHPKSVNGGKPWHWENFDALWCPLVWVADHFWNLQCHRGQSLLDCV